MTNLTPKKKLNSVSPSQVIAYRQCPRIWFWQSVLYDRFASTRSNVLGDAIHKALECYMKTGEVLPTVTLPAPYLPEPGATETFETLVFIQAAIEHLPKPATHEFWKQFEGEEHGYGVMAEQEGETITYEGGPGWVQYIDLVTALPGPRGRITDYKSKSNARYIKTPAELAVDVQLMANAKWLFQASDYEEIELTHLNLLTRGRVKAIPVSTVVTRAQVDAVWAETMATVREMEAHAAIHDRAESLPPNTESCDKYGGCRKLTACGFSKPIPVRSLFKMSGATSTGSSVLDGLLGGAAKAPGASPAASGAAPAPGLPGGLGALLGGPAKATAIAVAPVTTSVPVSAPVAVPAPAAPTPVSSLSALLGGGPNRAAPAPAASGPSPAAQAAAVAAGYPVDFAPAGGIVPPDAPPATSTPEEVAEANAGNTAEKEEDEEIIAPAEASEVPAFDGLSGKTRRKRRTKLEMEAARAAEAAGTPPVLMTKLPEVIATAATTISLGTSTSTGPLAAGQATLSDLLKGTAVAVEKASTQEIVAAVETAKQADAVSSGRVGFVGPAESSSLSSLVGALKSVGANLGLPIAAESPAYSVSEMPVMASLLTALKGVGVIVEDAKQPGPIAAESPAYSVSEMPVMASLLTALKGVGVIVEDAKQPGPIAAVPVDPIAEQIKARLKTPDSRFACTLKYLFIDCMPGKGWPVESTPIDVREIWHAFTTNAAAAADVADYRFVKYESKGYLGASIRAMLRGLPVSVYVDSAVPDVQEFLTAVIPYAEMVFRGR